MSGYQTQYNKIINSNAAGSTALNKALTGLLGEMVDTIVSASPSLERYADAVHPEEFTKSREVMRGLVPTLRPQSIPYLLSASVFMALISIFIIFQMIGVSGQLTLSPAVLALFVSPAGATPFYQNPMVLGGLSILLAVAVVTLGVGYYRKSQS